jgi:hypothetical protein
MQEGKVVFAVGQIAQVRIQSFVYEGFLQMRVFCRNCGPFQPCLSGWHRIWAARVDRSDADPNTTNGPDIPVYSGNLRRCDPGAGRA